MSLNSIGIVIKNQSDCELEKAALDDFLKNIKVVDGRYQARWPWKLYPPPLPNTKKMALARLRSQITTFKKHPHLFEQYNQYFKNLESLCIIEIVSPNMKKANTLTMHLPHQRDVDYTKSIPLKVVINGAAKTKKDTHTVNECLHKGLNLIPAIFALLIRFRFHAIALTSDIQRAFHQIDLHEDDTRHNSFLLARRPRSPTY